MYTRCAFYCIMLCTLASFVDSSSDDSYVSDSEESSISEIIMNTSQVTEL